MTKEEIIEPHIQTTKYGTRILEIPDVENCMDSYATHIALEALKQHGISDTVAHYTIEKLLKDNQ
jgi:hypothetical protein